MAATPPRLVVSCAVPMALGCRIGFGLAVDRGPDATVPGTTPSACQPGETCRSVGTNAGVIYATGVASIASGGTVVELGGGADLPLGIVGAGDAIELGESPNSETLYILGRESSTRVTVQAAAASSHLAVPYRVRRAFNSLVDWETAREGDLVAEQRIEVAVAYNDGPLSPVVIDGSITDATFHMKLTAAHGQRHVGRSGTGVVVDCADSVEAGISVGDPFAVVEWIEVVRCTPTLFAAGIRVQEGGVDVLVSHVIARANSNGIRLHGSAGKRVRVRNCVIYANTEHGIRGDEAGDHVEVENCTLYSNGNSGIDGDLTSSLLVANTLSVGNRLDFERVPEANQSHNMSGDRSAGGPGSLTDQIPSEQFVSLVPGAEDLHLAPGATAIDAGDDRSASFSTDIDGAPRTSGAWDIGADER